MKNHRVASYDFLWNVILMLSCQILDKTSLMFCINSSWSDIALKNPFWQNRLVLHCIFMYQTALYMKIRYPYLKNEKTYIRLTTPNMEKVFSVPTMKTFWNITPFQHGYWLLAIILCHLAWSYGSWIDNWLCNQCLSPLNSRVRIPLMARCT